MPHYVITRIINVFHAVLRIRIRDPVPFDPWTWIRDPEQVFFRIPDPGSRIPDPNHIFLKLSDKYLGKKFYNSLNTGPNFFLQHLKNKIIFSFVKFVAIKKGLTTNFFRPSLLLLFLDLGSEIRDPEWVKSGSGIRDKHPGSATLISCQSRALRRYVRRCLAAHNSTLLPSYGHFWWYLIKEDTCPPFSFFLNRKEPSLQRRLAGAKKSDPDPGSGSGMNNVDHIPQSLETIFFWAKKLKFFDADSESGMGKIWIRDKHPGSATLIKCMIPGVIGDRFVEKEVRFEHVQTIFRRIRCFLY